MHGKSTAPARTDPASFRLAVLRANPDLANIQGIPGFTEAELLASLQHALASPLGVAIIPAGAEWISYGAERRDAFLTTVPYSAAACTASASWRA